MAVAMSGAAIVASPAQGAQPPYIPADSGWLTVVNYYRAMSDLPPVVENASHSDGAVKHSCYMLQNGISHGENPSAPGYTPEGAAAGANGNVAVSSVFNASARSHIELWMTGPFHAIGLLRPHLASAGFGKCDNANTNPWRSAATLDVLRGLQAPTARTTPIVFPGSGSTVSLDRFVTESPNPLDFCGWNSSQRANAGLPIIALMPEGVSPSPSATVSGSGGSIGACVLTQHNTSGIAQQILAGDNAVVVIPMAVLAPDTYSVSITTASRSLQWSFSVDPAAANGIEPPTVTEPLGENASFKAVTPARIVDTRVPVGATPLVGTLQKRIQITGHGGIPDHARAVSANVTVTDAGGPGFLTVWNCAAERPVVSTLNFSGPEAVPNGASIPLDDDGGLCVYASVSAQLVIDVNGYYSTKASGKFSPVTPHRLMDSRLGLGVPGRLGAGTTHALRVTDVAGVPEGTRVVSLNVTSVLPAAAGFITVYACHSERPDVSSLNPIPGRVKPNVVLAPVASDGTVCLYTLNDVDVVVDITGYIAGAGDLEFTPATPFRLADTRERNRPEMTAGTNGDVARQGQILTVQVAGVRGVDENARAVSANFTVVGGAAPGYLTAFPCGAPPSTSTVNFEAGEAIANGAHLPLSSSGQLCVFVSNDAHVVIDINGWWS